MTGTGASSKPTGLHCPGCGRRAFRTLDSRPAHGGRKRRLICTHCEFRVSTFESITGSTPPQDVRRAGGEVET